MWVLDLTTPELKFIFVKFLFANFSDKVNGQIVIIIAFIQYMKQVNKSHKIGLFKPGTISGRAFFKEIF